MTLAFDIHAASVPAFLQTLGALDKILDKAKAWAEARKIDGATLVGWRLAPDMLTMGRQVQIMCDFAKGATARLAGAEVPSWPDDEKTFDELKARIAKTVAFVKGFSPEQFKDAASREITITIRGMDPLKFDGQTYLVHFALPNFYFHATTAYANLRNAGLEIGKGDFMGR